MERPRCCRFGRGDQLFRLLPELPIDPLPTPLFDPERSDCERSDRELPDWLLPDWPLAEREPIELPELEPELLCMPG